MDLDKAKALAADLSATEKADIYLYNGSIERGHDLSLIRVVQQNQAAKKALLFLVTRGGDPDAGYKMARFLQHAYESFVVVLPGLCKSAGTLIAAGAHELRFGVFGEMGPLDIQTYKTDNLLELQSGLSISEAIETLVNSAIKKHAEMFSSMLVSTSGVVSFSTAAGAATDLVNGLFAPIFGRVDPYEVGDKARAMRIALDYGKRLSSRTNNLKSHTLNALTRTYPSHSFVVDKAEAELLFNAVRAMSAKESEIASVLSDAATDELQRKSPLIECLARWQPQGGDENASKSATVPRSRARRNGRNPAGAAPAAILPASSRKRRRR